MGWVVNVTPLPLYSRERRGTYCTGGPDWTGAENLSPTGIRSTDRLSRSGSLYRLSYPGPSSTEIAFRVLFVNQTVDQFQLQCHNHNNNNNKYLLCIFGNVRNINCK